MYVLSFETTWLVFFLKRSAPFANRSHSCLISNSALVGTSLAGKSNVFRVLSNEQVHKIMQDEINQRNG